MAIPAKTEAELRQEIKSLVQSDSEPILQESQIDILVRQSFLKDSSNYVPDLMFERVGSKRYTVGMRMVPMNRNGHSYICVQSGVTSAIEPTFPGETEEVITDGTVVWNESSIIYWTPTYNPFAAIGFGWEMKASMCVADYQFSSDGQTFNRQQVYEHCMKQAAEWRKRTHGTTRVQSALRNSRVIPDAFTPQYSEQRLEDLGLV